MNDGERLDAEARLQLPAHPISASRARRFISEFCDAAELPDELCQTATLLASELVANAIIHGGSSATLEIHRPAGTMRVAVRDDNPQLPAIGDHPTVTAQSGRGLMIVSMLADAWGIEATEHGKSIWFELHAGTTNNPSD